MYSDRMQSQNSPLVPVFTLVRMEIKVVSMFHSVKSFLSFVLLFFITREKAPKTGNAGQGCEWRIENHYHHRLSEPWGIRRCPPGRKLKRKNHTTTHTSIKKTTAKLHGRNQARETCYFPNVCHEIHLYCTMRSWVII